MNLHVAVENQRNLPTCFDSANTPDTSLCRVLVRSWAALASYKPGDSLSSGSAINVKHRGLDRHHPSQMFHNFQLRLCCETPFISDRSWKAFVFFSSVMKRQLKKMLIMNWIFLLCGVVKRWLTTLLPMVPVSPSEGQQFSGEHVWARNRKTNTGIN